MNDSRPIRVGIIMAGGTGERFWPLSRRHRPKQLLPLTRPELPMLTEAVQRLQPLIAPEQVYIITAKHLVDPIRRACTGVPEANVIGEPCKRNTAGCLCYAAAQILAQYGEAGTSVTMAVTTADHFIGEEPLFRDTIEQAMIVAEQENALVVHGITPTRADTGYGYVEAEAPLTPLAQFGTDIPVYRVEQFREKPDLVQAEKFVTAGNYFWNSGMFFWTVGTFFTELAKAQPSMVEATHAIAEALRSHDQNEVTRQFEALESISIDYALMEHATDVLVVKASYPWDDMGCWPALERSRPSDDHGNILEGDAVILDCQGCIVCNDASDTMAVGVLGLEDVVVVATEDAVLVVPKARAQEVRRVVEALKQRQAPQV